MSIAHRIHTSLHNRPWFLAGIVGLTTFIAASLLAWQNHERWHTAIDERNRQLVATESLTVRSHIFEGLHNVLTVPIALSAWIATNPEDPTNGLENYLVHLGEYPELTYVGFQTDAVQTMLLRPGEPATDVRAQLAEIGPSQIVAIRTRSAAIEGPVVLPDGRHELRVMQPVFVEGYKGAIDVPGFWGFVAVHIDVETLLAAHRPELNHIASYALRTTGSKPVVFAGDPALFDEPLFIDTIALPFGAWEIAAAPKLLPQTWNDYIDFALMELFVLALSVAFYFVISRQGLADMRRAKEAAERANKLKSDFLVVMSHEMRTPLNGILGTLELLADTDLDDQQKTYTRIARSSAEHLLDHVNGVLDIEKIESGRFVLASEPLDLRAIAGGTAEEYAAQAGRRGTAIGCDIDLPAGTVYGDESAIRQVLTNLVSNAVKFTANGRVTIGARAKDQGDGTRMVTFTVADTGSGIAPEAQRSIFEDFVTLDASYNRRAEGTGLGLGITRRLVAAMGGTINLQSALGEGTTFIVQLPLAMSRQSASGTGEKANAAPVVARASQVARKSA